VLTCLRGVGVTLATVIGQYHSWGVVPLQRRPLHLCEMTADRATLIGTMTALEFPSLNEIQHHMALAIRKSTFTWLRAQILPMLPTGRRKNL
jgi:hypothetical protein